MKTLEMGTEVKLKNVLFATDFSRYSNAALPYAFAIAQQYGVKLFAAHVLSPESYLFTVPEGWNSLLEKQSEIDSKKLEEQLRGVPHEVLSPVGDISDVIFKLVRDNHIDLLVVGTHGRSGLPKLLLGSVAEKLFRLSSIPVLTVGPHVVRGEKLVAEFNRIVFVTDFSEESLAAKAFAIALAREHHSRLSVLNVLQHPQAGTVNLEADMDFAFRQLEQIIPPTPDLWFQPEYFVEVGDAAETIRTFASKHGADLIIMGIRPPARSIGSLTHFSHSTAQDIMAYATCPVLTVRG